MAEERLNVKQVAKIFGVSKSTIIRRITSKDILEPYINEYGFYYWLRDEFEAYLIQMNKEILMRCKNGS